MIEQPFKKPPPSGDFQPPPKPKRYWWRFLVAAVVIVVACGSATAVSALLYVNSIANALSHNNVLQGKVQKFLAQTNGGEPENILIIGSDKRASEPEDPGRSDTTILLRLDPDKGVISLMSIPRDLKTEIPGVGTNKFNAAYTYGGPKLTLQVVKEMTGLPINHVVNVDYLGFVRAVDAIGCVYVDIDRRYYHSNAGLPVSEQYSEINIQPGYQKLCGKKALQYVRYRHTDTDLVRAGRQQDFLSDARQRVPIADLVLDKHQLIDIFTEYTTSDISDAETMLQVLKLFIASRNSTINEVNFPAELGPSYVYSSPEMIEEAVEKFLGSEASGGPRGSLDSEPGGSGGAKSGGNRNDKKGKKAREVEAEGEAAGERRARPGKGSGRSRGRRRHPQGQRRIPRLLPDQAAVGGRLRGNRPLRTCRRSARLPPQGHRRQSPRRLPDGRRPSNSPTGSTTSGCRESRGGATRRSSATRA